MSDLNVFSVVERATALGERMFGNTAPHAVDIGIKSDHPYRYSFPIDNNYEGLEQHFDQKNLYNKEAHGLLRNLSTSDMIGLLDDSNSETAAKVVTLAIARQLRNEVVKAPGFRIFGNGSGFCEQANHITRKWSTFASVLEFDASIEDVNKGSLDDLNSFWDISSHVDDGIAVEMIARLKQVDIHDFDLRLFVATQCENKYTVIGEQSEKLDNFRAVVAQYGWDVIGYRNCMAQSHHTKIPESVWYMVRSDNKYKYRSTVVVEGKSLPVVNKLQIDISNDVIFDESGVNVTAIVARDVNTATWR